MNLENVCSTRKIRKAKFNFSIETPWTDKSWIEGVWSVSCHEDLNVATRIKTIQLVDQLQHSALYFVIASCAIVETSPTNGVDFIEENDAGLLGASQLEELSHHSSTFADVLLHQLRTNHTNETGVRSIGHRTST